MGISGACDFEAAVTLNAHQLRGACKIYGEKPSEALVHQQVNTVLHAVRPACSSFIHLNTEMYLKQIFLNMFSTILKIIIWHCFNKLLKTEVTVEETFAYALNEAALNQKST